MKCAMETSRTRMLLTSCACVLALAVLSGQSELARRISLDFNATAPESVFRMVAEAIKCSLKVDPTVNQNVTIHLDRVTVKLALDAVCESIGCRWTFDGRQLIVTPSPGSPIGGVVGNSDFVRAALAKPLPSGLRFDRQSLGTVLDAVSRAAGPGFDFRVDGPEAKISISIDVSGRPPMEAVQAIVAAAGLKARLPISSRVDDDRVIRSFSVKLVLLPPDAPAALTLNDVLARAGEAARAFAVPDRRIVCEESDRLTILKKPPFMGVGNSVDDPAPVATRTIAATLSVSPSALDAKATNAPWEEVRQIVSAGRLQPAGPSKSWRVGYAPDVPVIWSAPLPRLAAVLLYPTNQPRFVFTKAGERRINGANTWEVQFRETAMPALLTAPINGSLWVDPASGQVLRSVIRIAKSGPIDEMTVTYALDRATGLWLPSALKQRTDLRDWTFVENSATFTKCRAVPIVGR